MKRNSPKFILVISYSIFLFLGMYNASIGPILGDLAAQANSSLSAIGGVITFLFLGALIAQITAGPLNDRFGQKLLLIISLLLLGTGIIGFINARNLPLMFIFILIAGLGQGGVDLGGNLILADAFPKTSTSVLNLLHFFFGAGAFIGPAIVGISISLNGTSFIMHWISAGFFLLIACIVLIFLTSNVRVRGDVDFVKEIKTGGLNFYRSPLLWLLGLLLLIFVGIEYALGGWITLFMKNTTNMTIENGAVVTSAYWGALALGRLVSAGATRMLTPIRLLSIAIISSLIGGIGLLMNYGVIVPSIIFIVWISFSYGTVMPTAFSIAASAFPEHKGKAVGVLASMGSIGGLTLPWIAGLLVANQPNQSFVWFIDFWIALLLVVLFFVNKKLEHGQPSN